MTKSRTVSGRSRTSPIYDDPVQISPALQGLHVLCNSRASARRARALRRDGDDDRAGDFRLRDPRRARGRKLLAWLDLSARRAHDGRSWMNQQIFDPIGIIIAAVIAAATSAMLYWMLHPPSNR